MAAFLAYLGSGGQNNNGNRVLSAAAMREWMLPRFLQPDGQSGFGMPWEIQLGAGGWMLTKAGDIDQFGSIMCFNPASTLGVWIAVNSPGPEATALFSAFNDQLNAAVNQAIAEAAAATASMPLRAREFVGVFDGYVAVLGCNMTINITMRSNDGGSLPQTRL